MSVSRRSFFANLCGAAAAVGVAGVAGTALIVAPRQPSKAEADLMALQEAFERLRQTMEKPIELKIRIGGRTFARSSMTVTPHLDTAALS